MFSLHVDVVKSHFYIYFEVRTCTYGYQGYHTLGYFKWTILKCCFGDILLSAPGEVITFNYFKGVYTIEIKK